MEISSKKNIVKNWFVILQDIITNDIEKLENKKNVFKIKNWSRGQNEGGGQFRIFENGKLFEKVGVNFSEVYGKFPKKFKGQIPGTKKKFKFLGIRNIGSYAYEESSYTCYAFQYKIYCYIPWVVWRRHGCNTMFK